MFKLSSIAIVVVLAVATPSLLVPQEKCAGSKTEHNGLCANCTGNISGSISDGDDCVPCTFNWSYAYACPGSSGALAQQNVPLACGRGVEHRISCPSGGAWLAISFACSNCE